jgi:hypothetical protein
MYEESLIVQAAPGEEIYLDEPTSIDATPAEFELTAIADAT